MKKLLPIIILINLFNCFGQLIAPEQIDANKKINQEQDAKPRPVAPFKNAKEVIKAATFYFNEGKTHFKNGSKETAKTCFDIANDIVLDADIKPEEKPILEEFYEKLRKDIYEIEFGEAAPPISAAESERDSKDQIILVPVQPTCSMPALQKIKPGMTLSEAQKLFKAKFTITNSPDFPSLPNAKRAVISGQNNTRAIFIDYVKERVYAVTIVYKDNIDWENLAEFTQVSVKNLNLPLDKLTYKTGSSYLTESKYANEFNLSCENVIFRSEKTTFGYLLAVGDLDLIRIYLDENLKAYLKIQDAKRRRKSTFKP